MNHFFPVLTSGTVQVGQTLDFLSIFLSVMLFGSAFYGLYAAIRVRVTFMLFPNKFLFPANCKPEDCLDEDGYIDYIVPRLMAWSILMLLIGIVYTLNAFVFFCGGWIIDIATIVVPVAVVGWLMVIQRLSAKRFWGV